MKKIFKKNFQKKIFIEKNFWAKIFDKKRFGKKPRESKGLSSHIKAGMMDRPTDRPHYLDWKWCKLTQNVLKWTKMTQN